MVLFRRIFNTDTIHKLSDLGFKRNKIEMDTREKDEEYVSSLSLYILFKISLEKECVHKGALSAVLIQVLSRDPPTLKFAYLIRF